MESVGNVEYYYLYSSLTVISPMVISGFLIPNSITLSFDWIALLPAVRPLVIDIDDVKSIPSPLDQSPWDIDLYSYLYPVSHVARSYILPGLLVTEYVVKQMSVVKQILLVLTLKLKFSFQAYRSDITIGLVSDLLFAILSQL